jgi:hypothetical protein
MGMFSKGGLWEGGAPNESTVRECKAVVDYINTLQDDGYHHHMPREVWEWMLWSRDKCDVFLREARERVEKVKSIERYF